MESFERLDFELMDDDNESFEDGISMWGLCNLGVLAWSIDWLSDLTGEDLSTSSSLSS